MNNKQFKRSMLNPIPKSDKFHKAGTGSNYHVKHGFLKGLQKYIKCSTTNGEDISLLTIDQVILELHRRGFVRLIHSDNRFNSEDTEEIMG